MMGTKSISVPRSFFASERDNVYSDWRLAFWRELFSNSVDAGATGISVKATFAPIADGDEAYRIFFRDNGCGMDAATIENVYMRLGASTKRSDDQSIGGFGRARILTCFSQQAYQIASRNVLVSGSGAEYRIVETDNFVNGCMLMIDAPREEAYFLQKKLLEFLSTSSMKVKLKLELAEDTPEHPMPGLETEGNSPFRRGRHIFNFTDSKGPWGEVWINKSVACRRNALLVRVNGIAMHEEWLAEPIQVVVDLFPDRAREMLTASRDGLCGDFRRTVLSYVQELAANVVSATRKKEPTRSLTYSSGGAISVARQPAGKPVPPPGDNDPVVADTTELPAARPATRHDTGQVQINAEKESRSGNPFLHHDFHLCVDDATRQQRRNQKQLEPETWLETDKDGRLLGKSARYLLAAWTEVVRELTKIMIQIEPGLPDNLRVVPGFIVSEHLRGRCTQETGDTWQVLVNPLRADGRLRYALSDPKDRKRLISIAMHEVTHMAVDYHNEFYAERLTTLAGEVRDSELDRSMRLAMTNMKERTAAIEAELEARLRAAVQSSSDDPGMAA